MGWRGQVHGVERPGPWGCDQIEAHLPPQEPLDDLEGQEGQVEREGQAETGGDLPDETDGAERVADCLPNLEQRAENRQSRLHGVKLFTTPMGEVVGERVRQSDG